MMKSKRIDTVTLYYNVLTIRRDPMVYFPRDDGELGKLKEFFGDSLLSMEGYENLYTIRETGLDKLRWAFRMKKERISFPSPRLRSSPIWTFFPTGEEEVRDLHATFGDRLIKLGENNAYCIDVDDMERILDFKIKYDRIVINGKEYDLHGVNTLSLLFHTLSERYSHGTKRRVYFASRSSDNKNRDDILIVD